MKFVDFDRGTETEEQIQKRLRNAKAELKQGNSPGLFNHLLVNDDLETCYASLKVILILHIAVECIYPFSFSNCSYTMLENLVDVMGHECWQLVCLPGKGLFLTSWGSCWSPML